MRSHLRRSLVGAVVLHLLVAQGTPVGAQTSFDHDRGIAATAAPDGILTEGFPGAPVLGISATALGLVPGDDIDALSFGDDTAIAGLHALLFSVEGHTCGLSWSGTAIECTYDTPPGTPSAACADVFLQIPGSNNVLAPPGLGYEAGTGTGDEANAGWASDCNSGMDDDLDAFDFTDPAAAAGVYFSLKAGSPSVSPPSSFTPGDILYSDLSGSPPVLASLAGAGSATDDNLGITGLDLDALNVVGTVGPVASGGGVIAAGVVGDSLAGSYAPASTHLVQYSVASAPPPPPPITGSEVLVRILAGAITFHTAAAGLGLLPGENVDALEARSPGACPDAVLATLTHYNGTCITNAPVLICSPVIVGGEWTASLYAFGHSVPGFGILLVRGNPRLGCAVLTLPGGPPTELLVAPPYYTNLGPVPYLLSSAPMIFTQPIPASTNLCGVQWAAQGFVSGGFMDLSSAVTGFVGW